MAVAARIGVRYRGDDDQLVSATLDRVDPTAVLAGGPVRRFRSFKGQRHYSGWYSAPAIETCRMRHLDPVA